MNSDPTIVLSSQRRFIWLALAGFVLCYAGVLVSLANVWSSYPLYSFGFGVPLISGYLVWVRSRQAPPTRRRPDYAFGAPLIGVGLLLLIIGHAGTLQTIKQASMLVTAAGLVLVLFGRETLRVYRFAFAYLSLMVPIWDFLFNQLQHPSQLLSARVAESLLPLAGIPVLREGTRLALPSVVLSVMPQCSGVNQLVVLIAMVLPAAYLWLDTYARRALLFLIAIAVGYFSNGFRIALVGWLATNHLGDGDLVASYAHLLEGLVVSAAGYGIIVGVLSVLSRWNTRQAENSTRPAARPRSLQAATPRRLLPDVAVLVMLLLAAVSPLAARSPDAKSAGGLQRFPETVGHWVADLPGGVPAAFPGISEDLVGAYPTEAGVRRFARVDDELFRSYRDGSFARVNLYIGYYRQQHEGRELTGDASQVLEAASNPLSLITSAGPVTVREIVHDRHGRRQGLIFWYDINGRIATDRYDVKKYTILNGLLRQRTSGAVVVVAWEESGPSQSGAHERAVDFAQAILPITQHSLPH